MTTLFIKSDGLSSAAEGDNMAYLSELNWTNVSTGWGEAKKDTGLDGNPIVLRTSEGNQVTYAKGITVHAASKIDYDITDCKAEKFEAYIGICDSSNIDSKQLSSCEFIVQADDVQLYKSGVIKIATGNKKISVTIPEGAKKLTLITTDGGDGNNSDHSVWADAKLFMSTDKLTELKSVRLKSDSNYIEQGGTVAFSAIATLYNGSETLLEASNLKFSSSNSSVASVSENGTVTGKSDGIATVICTATVNGISKTGTADIIVGDNTQGEVWSVTSPDGNTKAVFALNKAGEIHYTVQKGGEIVVGLSPLGLNTNRNDFSEGLNFVNVSELQEINETYSVVSRKKEQYNNHAFEKILSFSKGNMGISITARAYNDGFAFRYSVSGDFENMKISGEQTAFRIPEYAKTWAMPYTNGAYSYEGMFSEQTIESLNGDQSMPMLYETTSGTFVLLSEAELTGEFVGSMLKKEQDGLMRLSFTPQQGSDTASSDLPFTSPWRFGVIGTLADITENTMVENLSPDPDSGIDYSFVEPGMASWSWMAGESGYENHTKRQHDPDLIKQYIDLSSRMGWKYFIMDEGWQPPAPSGSDSKYSGYYDWFPQMQSYAESKGVGLIAWVICDDLNTPEKRQARLADWKNHGIKGIKVDFFDRETQDRTKLYEEIYTECANLGLIVNAHGSNKPNGEVRTYPNVLTREGIHGQEFGGLSATQYTILPFTRTAIGPADVTETIYPMDNNTTAGFQSALSVLVQSGLHCLASGFWEYESSPAYSLYKNLPVVWDDTKFIDGYPGKFTTLVRRSGENWYGATVTKDAGSAVFPLDFLDSGTYYALIYKDGSGDKNDLDLEVQKVTKSSVLTVPMKAGGGCAVKIVRNVPDNITSVILDKTNISLQEKETASLTAQTVPENPEIRQLSWVSSNPEIASVSSDGLITGLKRGRTTITVSSLFDDTVKTVCEVTVTAEKYMHNTKQWNIVRENDEYIRYISENSVSITSQIGEIGETEGNGTPIKNIFVMNPGDDNFEITVKVNGSMTKSFQTAALVAYTDEKNLVGTMRRYHGNFGGNCFEGMKYANGYNEQTVPDTQKDIPAYLKLEKKDKKFISSYSYDSVSWTKISEVEFESIGSADKKDIKIGVYAGMGLPEAEMTMTFEEFTYSSSSVQKHIIPFARLARDIDDDGSVNVSDVVELRRMIMRSGLTDDEKSICDVDKDGLVTVSDVVELRKRIMEG